MAKGEIDIVGVLRNLIAISCHSIDSTFLGRPDLARGKYNQSLTTGGALRKSPPSSKNDGLSGPRLPGGLNEVALKLESLAKQAAKSIICCGGPPRRISSTTDGSEEIGRQKEVRPAKPYSTPGSRG